MNRPGYWSCSRLAAAARSAGCQVQTLAIPVPSTSRSVAASATSTAARSAGEFMPGYHTDVKPAASISRV
jgi:hypothetical protein